MTQCDSVVDSDLLRSFQMRLSVGRRAALVVKRVLDVVLSLVGLLVSSPVLLAVGIAIRLDSPGPAIFRQPRVGREGKMFVPFKFRTMYVSADDRPHREAVTRLAAGKPVGVINGKPSFKPLEDPRVTRVGRFLRATGLDELPQLLNVLRGEMSIVGPRPAILYELEFYKDWYYRRFVVPPGITGLWQVQRHQTSTFEDIIRRDLQYIDSFSLWLDLRVMLLTIPRIVFRRWTF